MLTRIFASIALLLILFTSPAAADDPNDVGTAHSQAFAKACAAGDIPGVLALYEDQATVIWPGLGEVAHGKVEIEKLAATLCKSGQPGPIAQVPELKATRPRLHRKRRDVGSDGDGTRRQTSHIGGSHDRGDSSCRWQMALYRRPRLDRLAARASCGREPRSELICSV
jgi:hypothetical protein